MTKQDDSTMEERAREFYANAAPTDLCIWGIMANFAKQEVERERERIRDGLRNAGNRYELIETYADTLIHYLGLVQEPTND